MNTKAAQIKNLSIQKEDLLNKSIRAQQQRHEIQSKLSKSELELTHFKDGKGLLLETLSEAKIHDYWIDLPTYKGSIKGLSAKVTQLKLSQVEIEIVGSGVV